MNTLLQAVIIALIMFTLFFCGKWYDETEKEMSKPIGKCVRWVRK